MTEPLLFVDNAAAETRTEEAEGEPFYNTSKGFFGVELDHEAPIVVCDCIEFLRVDGIDKEGVFRANGNALRITELIEAYNKNFNTTEAKLNKSFCVLTSMKSVLRYTDVSGLLKRFFRDLPTKMFSEKLTQEFILAGHTGETDEDVVDNINKILCQLPPFKRKLLGMLVEVLRETLQYTEKNKMDSKALSTVWIPCLFSYTQNNVHSFAILESIHLGFEKLLTLELVSLEKPSQRTIILNTRFDRKKHLRRVAKKEKKGMRGGSFLFRPSNSKRGRESASSQLSSFRSAGNVRSHFSEEPVENAMVPVNIEEEAMKASFNKSQKKGKAKKKEKEKSKREKKNEKKKQPKSPKPKVPKGKAKAKKKELSKKPKAKGRKSSAGSSAKSSAPGSPQKVSRNRRKGSFFLMGKKNKDLKLTEKDESLQLAATSLIEEQRKSVSTERTDSLRISANKKEFNNSVSNVKGDKLSDYEDSDSESGMSVNAAPVAPPKKIVSSSDKSGPPPIPPKERSPPPPPPEFDDIDLAI